MSANSSKLRRSTAERRVVTVQHLLDVVEVLSAIAEISQAINAALSRVPAFQRLERYAAMQRLGIGMETQHSDPENGVAQADDSNTEVF